MVKRSGKAKDPGRPVERHHTAAWSDRDRLLHLSEVNLPDEMQVYNAKEYADENEK